MYRIELSPGEETVFRSIEELAVAIKRGVVTPRARIYHNTTGNWLPIQFHPHYKAAVSMPLTQAELVAGPPHKQLSSLTLQPTEPDLPPAPPPARVNHEAASSAVESPAPKKKKASEQPKKRPRRNSKPRRELRIALVGALLLGGAQWVLSARLFSQADTPLLIHAQRQVIRANSELRAPVSSPNSAGMVPVLANPPSQTAATPLEDLVDVKPGPTVPSFGGTGSAASEIEAIEPAPSTTDTMILKLPTVDSLRASNPSDSAGKARPKQILQRAGGTPQRLPRHR
jgi:hypothetical protein